MRAAAAAHELDTGGLDDLDAGLAQGVVGALVVGVADDAKDFASRWLQAYRDREQEAERAATIVTRPGPGACRLL